MSSFNTLIGTISQNFFLGSSSYLSLKRVILHVQEILKIYLLTPRCRVFLQKLTGLQLVKKFPAFHGIRRFITALTNVRHLSVSWASPIKSIYPHHTSLRSVLILSTHLELGLPYGLFVPQLLTYSLTPCCRVLLWRLTGLQLLKKFPAFHGTRRFITAHKSVRQLSLSWISPIQSIYTHPTSFISVLILSTHLHLGPKIYLRKFNYKL